MGRKRKQARPARFNHDSFSALKGSEVHTLGKASAWTISVTGFEKLVRYLSASGSDWIHKAFRI